MNRDKAAAGTPTLAVEALWDVAVAVALEWEEEFSACPALSSLMTALSLTTVRSVGTEATSVTMVVDAAVALTVAQEISLPSRTGKMEVSAAAVVVAEAIRLVAGTEVSVVVAAAGLIAAPAAAWGAGAGAGVAAVDFRAAAAAAAVSAAAFS